MDMGNENNSANGDRSPGTCKEKDVEIHPKDNNEYLFKA